MNGSRTRREPNANHCITTIEQEQFFHETLLRSTRKQLKHTAKTRTVLPNDVPLRFYKTGDSRLAGISCSDGLIFAASFAGWGALTILRLPYAT
jgi:hypothetical protein